MDIIKRYDMPEPGIRAKITVYELYAENDTKLGMDFQSWKNNDGIALFSAGGRFSQNHNALELVRGADWNKTTYFQFNPKWNTKYIDYLTGRGKAKVLHSAELVVANNRVGSIEKFTQFFTAKTQPVTVQETTHKRGNNITVETTDKFGFSIKMTPSINTQATRLKVEINNSSLIGYTSDGSPRIQKGAEINTEFMIANSGTKLVIGGIEKRSIMQVNGGIPILKEIPYLGKLFSTETEAVKRSQLLIVAEVLPENKADSQKHVIREIKNKLAAI
jgi:type II secretory pathway component GspD/PulD (secretin)